MPKHTWTKEQEDFMLKNWGTMPLTNIAKKVGRSKNAVHQKSLRMDLPSCYRTGDYLNASEIGSMMGVNSRTVSRNWINKFGMKAKKFKSGNRHMYRVKFEDMVDWIYKNQNRWDVKRVKFEEFSVVPKWLSDKRKGLDTSPKNAFLKWSNEETSLLISYHMIGKSYKQISELMGRSHLAVMGKLCRLRKEGKV